MPIGEIVDFLYRVEFQQRGSPHIHALFWVRNAPEHEKNTNEEIIHFVQIAKTCKKGGHKICRFNFPLPPVSRSMILEPEIKLKRTKKTV